MDSERGDPPAVHRYHFHFSVRDRDAIAHPWQSSEFGERVAAQRGPVTFGDLYTVVGSNIDQRQRAGQLEHAVRDHRFARREIVFVGDVADDFLDQILHRDDAGGASVLIEHHGHVRSRLSEVVQDALRRPAVGDVHRLPHEIGEVERRVSGMEPEVFGEKDSDNVVEGIAVHRIARVALASQDLPDFLFRRLHVERDHISAGAHDAPRRARPHRCGGA